MFPEAKAASMSERVRAPLNRDGRLALHYNPDSVRNIRKQTVREYHMPKAYWVSAYQAIHDENKLAAYAKLAGPAVQEGGGKFLARGMAASAYEAGIKQRTVIVEFESLEKAIACHDGPGYQAALKALEGGVSRDLRIIEGV
jgi:uncharacterized protein (DUF1330 family)